MEKIHTPPPASLLIHSPAQHSTNLIKLVISAILFKHDPCKINFGENYDDYNVEAKCIANRLSHCHNDNQLKIVINNVFEKNFGSNWGHFISGVQKSVHLGFIARQIWMVVPIIGV